MKGGDWGAGKMRTRKNQRWFFNLYGEWERVAVIHGFVSQLIKERKFLKKHSSPRATTAIHHLFANNEG